MKKIKLFAVLFIAFTLIITLSSCNEEGEDSAEYVDALSIEQIQDDPSSFLGEITLTGIVGAIGPQAFILENETSTFDITVDYRGNQALPQTGDKVVVEGMLTENRPCCGLGFTLTSMQFEVMNN